MGQYGPEGFKSILITGLIISSALFILAVILYAIVNESYWISGLALLSVIAFAKFGSRDKDLK